ncbi:MAG: phosphohistidine phosphatase SixA [Nitrospinota bacterium]|nr:phosphohistidine phosphatase SixA [Nitrospinota bacterium]
MRLYLARHGEALPKHIDPQAPLSDTGRWEAETIAGFLADSHVRYEAIFHSGKTRARQTAEIFAQTAAEGPKPEQLDSIDPMDPPEHLLPTIAGWRQNTLVVGHNPFMGHLLGLLLGGHGAPALAEFSTCSVACLQRGSAGVWTLRWMVSPELFLGRG